MIRSTASASLLLKLFASSHLSAATTTLSFDTPIPGTITDSNSLGTGFTHRLPGTGSALPANDVNLDLIADPGLLTIRSASADTTSTSAYPDMETFGLRLPNIGSNDFSVSALFKNVDLVTSQLNLYVGSDSNNYVRAGFHPHLGTDQSVLVYGMVNAVQIDHWSQAAIGVLYGDDAILTLSRASGLMQLSWTNLTHPSSSGSSPLLSILTPPVNTYLDLYVGIYFNTPLSLGPSTELAHVESFSVNVVPEPSALVLAAIGMAALVGLSRRLDRTARRVSRIVAAAMLALAFLATDCQAFSPYSLNFSEPMPGTIVDANGLGTGFTSRLPGTGESIPANDPGLNLIDRPGYLQIAAANGNIGGVEGGYNLAITEAPGLLLDQAHSYDLAITAKFDDVDVPDYQFATYVGVRSTLSIRAGFHGPYQYYLAANDGTGGDFGWSSGPGAYIPGDDIILTLARADGLWSLSWDNLTRPLLSGSSLTSGIGTGSLSFPLLNAEPDLYAGVIHAATSAHVGAIDYFLVNVVPEPTGLLLAALALSGLLITARMTRPRRVQRASILAALIVGATSGIAHANLLLPDGLQPGASFF